MYYIMLKTLSKQQVQAQPASHQVHRQLLSNSLWNLHGSEIPADLGE